ncbi:hypothetical protein M378DRAFT_169216, partial [Amanita muscaria Koide BX008]
MMHTVIISFATVDAGRQPLASIQNVLQPAPVGDKDAVKNISVDTQEPSVHLSTVPSTLRRAVTINRMAGFATVVRRATRTVSLHRVRTINKNAGREILERRKASLTPDSPSNASNLKRVRTNNNKKAGREILERRNASLTTDSESIVSDTSTLVDHPVSLKRLRTIVGNAGRELLQRRKAALIDSPLTSPDNSCTPSSYFDIKRAKLGLEVAAPARRSVLEYPIIYFSKGTRIFTEKVSIRNIPVMLPTPEYEVRKRTRSIKFADELPEELSVGGRWIQARGA